MIELKRHHLYNLRYNILMGRSGHQMDLKVGMYVRCNIDDNKKDGRDFLIGNIVSINNDTDEVIVEFIDIYEKNKYYEEIPEIGKYYKDEVSHCKIREGSLVIYKNISAGEVLKYCNKDEEGYYNYYIRIMKYDNRIIKAKESEIYVQYDDGDYSPVDQLINYELQNPIWFKNRSIVSSSMNVMKNAPYGFELLLGSRVYLLPHQIYTVIRGISSEKCRLMLADEVGLGKTIEACVIFKGLKKRKRKFKALMIIPETLIMQWKNELSYKFWMDVPIWDDELDLAKEDTILISMDNILKEKARELLNAHWDLIIVDETHRLLNDKDRYSQILSLSKKTDNILILSATPIQERQLEYLSLLKLLNPEVYENMSIERFEKLLSKSKLIKDEIHELIRDLNYYIEDELCEDYIDAFKEINEKLQDKVLEKLISMIDINSEDQGLEIVKIILAYISKNYEIEKNIIRNRRLELSNKMAKRSCDVITYSMMGSEVQFYEIETYNSLVEYLDEIQSRFKDDIKLVIEFKKMFLSAMFSSPWALYNLLKGRISYIKHLSFDKIKLDTYKKAVHQLITFKEEEDLIENVLFNCERWMKSSEMEFKDLDYYEANPDYIKGRLLLALDYIDQNLFDKKIIIFTQWSETAKKMEEILIEKFSKETVAGFYKGKTSEEMDMAADRFQSDESCLYLVCDRLGGEGRNFQIADVILHIDLPWSPIELEQRIGRLDRIGRDITKDVLSIVFISEDTLEEDLFNLWNKGLNIFNESLSGIEIALGDVENVINESLYRDTKYGLKDCIEDVVIESEKMRKQVEKERYFDYAKRLDPRKESRLLELIKLFDDNSGKKLYESMKLWGDMVGLNSNSIPVSRKDGNVDFIITYTPNNFSINSAKNALFNPPNTVKALKRGRNKNILMGTFSRDLAINREDLIFFAPGEEVFDSITKNAIGSYKGRCTAIALRSNLNWEGFIYTWSVAFNIEYLIKNGIEVEKKRKISEFLPLKQIRTVHSINENSFNVDKNRVLEELDKWIQGKRRYSKEFVHLGKRGSETNFLGTFSSVVEYFKKLKDREKWTNYVSSTYNSSYEQAKKEVFKLINIDEIKEYLEDEIISNKASNIYFNNGRIDILEDKNLILENEAILKGLENIDLYLDSAIFVWLVNR